MTGLDQTARAAVFSFTVVMAYFSTSVFAQENSESLLITIVPSRPMEEIHAEIAHTAISSERSKTKLNNAQATLASVEARIKTKKMDIDDLAKQAKAAKKSGDAAGAVTLEANKKAAVRILNLLESRKELRKAEVETARAEMQLSNAISYALKLELELMLKRVEIDSFTATGTSSLAGAAANRAARTLEGKYLEAQKEAASKTEQSASKNKKVVEERQKLFKAQEKLLVS